VKDKWDKTPLYNAAKGGHEEVVRLLICEGSPFSDAMQEAIVNDNIDVVKMFIECGVGVDGCGLYGWPYLYFVVSTEMANILLDAGALADQVNPQEAGKSILHGIIIRGDDVCPDIARLLVVNGADLNAKDNCGWVPLHESAYRGNKEITEILLIHGAHPNNKTKYGRTPLYYAEEYNYKEVAELLKKYGGRL
jgi:ankyrin repeat protein